MAHYFHLRPDCFVPVALLLAARLPCLAEAVAPWLTDDHVKLLQDQARVLLVTVTQWEAAGRELEALKGDVVASALKRARPGSCAADPVETARKQRLALVRRCRSTLLNSAVRALITAAGVASAATGTHVDGVFEPWVNPDVVVKCLTVFFDGPDPMQCRLAQEADVLDALLCSRGISLSALTAKLAEPCCRQELFVPYDKVTVFRVRVQTPLERVACAGLLEVVAEALEGDSASSSSSPRVATELVSHGDYVWWEAHVPVHLALLPLRVSVTFGRDRLGLSTFVARPIWHDSKPRPSATLGARGRSWDKRPVRFVDGRRVFAADPARRIVRVMDADGTVAVYTDALVMPVRRGADRHMTMVAGAAGNVMLWWTVSEEGPCQPPAGVHFEPATADRAPAVLPPDSGEFRWRLEDTCLKTTSGAYPGVQGIKVHGRFHCCPLAAPVRAGRPVSSVPSLVHRGGKQGAGRPGPRNHGDPHPTRSRGSRGDPRRGPRPRPQTGPLGHAAQRRLCPSMRGNPPAHAGGRCDAPCSARHQPPWKPCC